jgi:hypothetical protein
MLYFIAERWDGQVGHWRWHNNAGEDLVNEWHQLTLLYDYSATSNDPVLYVDGVLLTDIEEMSEPMGTPADIPGDVFLGNRVDEERGFDGLLANIWIFDRVLEPAEIEALVNQIPADTGGV